MYKKYILFIYSHYSSIYYHLSVYLSIYPTISLSPLTPPASTHPHLHPHLSVTGPHCALHRSPITPLRTHPHDGRLQSPDFLDDMSDARADEQQSKTKTRPLPWAPSLTTSTPLCRSHRHAAPWVQGSKRVLFLHLTVLFYNPSFMIVTMI